MHAARPARARFRRMPAPAAACLLAAVVFLGLSPPATAGALPGAAASAVTTATAAVTTATAAAVPAVGDRHVFWMPDWSTNAHRQQQATVRWAGEHALIYVADDALLADTHVNALGAAFDTTIYPTLTAAFGLEPNPGIDGDPRVVILIHDFRDRPVGSIQGAFFPRDLAPGGDPRSNRREMIYLNLQAVISEPWNAGALAAHEFAHLIVHYRDAMLDPSQGGPEAEWLLEGFATYAERLCGYHQRVDSLLRAFSLHPCTNLTFWRGTRENYGASYAFVRYLAGRLGPEFLRALVEQPLDGPAGVNATLRAQGGFVGTSFNHLFDDWVVACFLDGTPRPVWPYSFDGLTVSAKPVVLAGAQPLVGRTEAANYGAVYLDFPLSRAEHAFQAVIDGADGAPLQAALISWHSAGGADPVVQRFVLSAGAVGGTVSAPPGFDRRTLVVWARGPVGGDLSYEFSFAGGADPAGGILFLDVAGGDYYYADVAHLLRRGVISGRESPAGSGLYVFAGWDDLWRAQFAKIVMESIGMHTPPIDNLGNPTFSDVPLVREPGGGYKAYPYDYVEEAAALGIVKGYSNAAPRPAFGPFDPVTRGQLAAMLVRGAAAAGRPMPAYTGGDRVFADVPVSHTFYREIMTAYHAGIFRGRSERGRLFFDPGSRAARYHVARMTANFIGYLDEHPAAAP